MKKNKKTQTKPHLLNDKSPFDIREAYKATRTNINFITAGIKGCKVIAITSSAQSEGKSTTTFNIAKAFAQVDNKVLIIDADLRRSQLHKLLDIERGVGLSNALVGLNELDKIIKTTEHGFDIITAGPTPPNPSELLASNIMDELINVLKKHYDFIFIDTPPVNVVSDALNFSKSIHGYIVTVRNGITTDTDVEMVKNKIEFANARLLGFIFNAADKFETHYSRYGKYSRYGYYKYGYGSSYNNDDK